VHWLVHLVTGIVGCLGIACLSLLHRTPWLITAGVPQKRRAVKLTEDSQLFEAGQLVILYPPFDVLRNVTDFLEFAEFSVLKDAQILGKTQIVQHFIPLLHHFIQEAARIRDKGEVHAIQHVVPEGAEHPLGVGDRESVGRASCPLLRPRQLLPQGLLALLAHS